MGPPKRRSPTRRSEANGASRSGARKATGRNFTAAPDSRQALVYIDRYGHKHTEAILRNWSPATIKALCVRRLAQARSGRDAGASCNARRDRPDPQAEKTRR